MKDKLNSRLNGWSRNLLSKAGKHTLIKSVLQATPVYSMSTFKIPTGVYNDMDGIVRKFWWQTDHNKGKYMALKAWDKICKPKREGGFGLRKFKDINSALLAKLGWKVAGNEQTLWTNMLRSKYLKGKSIFEIPKAKGSSYVW